MSWTIENNVISFTDGKGASFHPDAEFIYRQKDGDSFEYEGSVYGTLTSELGISVSVMSVDCVLDLELAGKKIVLKAYAERRNQRVPIPFVDGRFLDYAVFGSRLFYVSQTVGPVNDAVSGSGITDSSSLNYIQYMNLCSACSGAGIHLPKNIRITGTSGDEKPEPAGLNARLYPYQEKGYNWLRFMTEHECGSILADEMGLGKTIQIIALMRYLKMKKEDCRFLVAAPVSLLVNWERETAKFCPMLKTHIHHGRNRTGYYRDLLQYDVVITSYSNISSDFSMLNMIDWDLLVLDEAQNIKNPSAQRAVYAKRIRHKVGIAVTGTPFENHMTDIWSLMDFTVPGFFGSQREFESTYRDSVESAESIREFLSPFMLRRKVKDVAGELPDRVDIPLPLEMSDEEAALYENRRRQILSSSDLRPASLAEVQSLRMFCSHPAVYDSLWAGTDPAEISSKYQRLCGIVGEIAENGEKVIIFTSFNRMIEIMSRDLRERFGVQTFFINGSVVAEERQGTVDEFSAVPGAAVLILNPKAAGTGLNITAANHVIHYTLEWNPAVEDQASARVWRRGQEKKVFVYRLYYVNTIDEIINDRIEMKRGVSDAAVVGNDGTENDSAALMRVLSVSPVGGEV